MSDSPVQQVRQGGGKPGLSRWAVSGLTALGILSIIGIIYFTSGTPLPQRNTAPKDEGTAGEVGRNFEPEVPKLQRTATETRPMPSEQRSGGVMLGQNVATFQPAPLMAFADTRQPTDPAAAQARRDDPDDRSSGRHSAASDSDPLTSRLRVEDQAIARAVPGPDRNLTLAEGTPIPCLPDSPITSDVEGTFRCKVHGEVMSESGAVALLDDGAWIIGRVGQGLRRGQRRLFVVFTKIQFPGCRISIRSPGADLMGQAGLDGEINNHFFQRFGAYLGMAFLDTAMQAAVLAASNASGGNRGVQFNQFQNSGRQGGQALFQEDAAIPPTLDRLQAQPVVVRLTQDIDMSGCFRLRPRGNG